MEFKVPQGGWNHMQNRTMRINRSINDNNLLAWRVISLFIYIKQIFGRFRLCLRVFVYSNNEVKFLYIASGECHMVYQSQRRKNNRGLSARQNIHFLSKILKSMIAGRSLVNFPWSENFWGRYCFTTSTAKEKMGKLSTGLYLGRVIQCTMSSWLWLPFLCKRREKYSPKTRERCRALKSRMVLECQRYCKS